MCGRLSFLLDERIYEKRYSDILQASARRLELHLKEQNNDAFCDNLFGDVEGDLFVKRRKEQKLLPERSPELFSHLKLQQNRSPHYSTIIENFLS